MNIRSYLSFADLFSLLNASFGFLSIMMVIIGDLELAAELMLIAVIFDGLDGWVARKIKRHDQFEFGKNIDSLSDVISFGVAPGIILYSSCAAYSIPNTNIVVALLIVICGILRLSRFNIITDSSDENFVGLPIPSTALILGSFYLSGMFNIDITLVIMTVVSLLMVSTIDYPKFKGTKTMLAGSILIITATLPQNILIPILYLPAKLLFVVMILYLFLPFGGLYTKLLRRGANVR